MRHKTDRNKIVFTVVEAYYHATGLECYRLRADVTYLTDVYDSAVFEAQDVPYTVLEAVDLEPYPDGIIF